MDIKDVDYFILHQANEFILETLRKKLNIEKDKFIIELSRYGNTTSSTIPISLMNAILSKKIKPDSKVLLCGFGVGLSWGSCIIKISKELIESINK